jgi:hypothetical protein
MRWMRLLALVMLVGCANLPSSGDGIVALEVTLPPSLTLQEGASVQLTARALNAQGEVVTAQILWQTPDETVTVDELSGVVTGAAAAGTGRVQATVGTLRSDLITFTLVPAPTPSP